MDAMTSKSDARRAKLAELGALVLAAIERRDAQDAAGVYDSPTIRALLVGDIIAGARGLGLLTEGK
jgi:hypothetical protein